MQQIKDFPTFLKRFGDFHDSVIQKITFEYTERGKNVEIQMSARDQNDGEAWIRIKLLLEDVSEFRLIEHEKTTAQVIYEMHILELNDSVAVEFGGDDSDPCTKEKLRTSDAFALCSRLSFEVLPK